jgi:diguanylate cyclase (GGDEF)-like protein
MRRRRYCDALAGALLSTGAPLGLLLLRMALDAQFSATWLRDELRSDPWTYGYVTLSTLVVFAAFGYVLGRQADSLYVLAAKDTLTGLATRRVFEERLAHEHARAMRYGTAVSVLIADLDGLKAVNDRHGHGAGDEALRAVSSAIADGVRSTDVGARWGGDEFAVLAPSTGVEDALGLAERIRLLAERGHDGSRPITLSIGVASLDPATSGTTQSLLRDADAALYEAKRLGRNRVSRAPPRQ